MTGPVGATLDPPCTIRAGGVMYPMIAADGRAALAIYDQDERFQCLYVLDGDTYRLDHCAGCLEGQDGERIGVTTFGQRRCGHV